MPQHCEALRKLAIYKMCDAFLGLAICCAADAAKCAGRIVGCTAFALPLRVDDPEYFWFCVLNAKTSKLLLIVKNSESIHLLL